MRSYAIMPEFISILICIGNLDNHNYFVKINIDIILMKLIQFLSAVSGRIWGTRIWNTRIWSTTDHSDSTTACCSSSANCSQTVSCKNAVPSLWCYNCHHVRSSCWQYHLCLLLHAFSVWVRISDILEASKLVFYPASSTSTVYEQYWSMDIISLKYFHLFNR